MFEELSGHFEAEKARIEDDLSPASPETSFSMGETSSQQVHSTQVAPSDLLHLPFATSLSFSLWSIVILAENMANKT